jgi:hypothetical protein
MNMLEILRKFLHITLASVLALFWGVLFFFFEKSVPKSSFEFWVLLIFLF